MKMENNMKKFFKWFFIIIVSFLVLSILSFFVFKSTYKPSHLKEESEKIEKIIVDDIEDKKEDIIYKVVKNVISEDDLYKKMISDSDRVNILLFGTDGYRADTLILFSYSKDANDVSLFSIPRDTKNEVEGMNALGQDKINAVFCFPNGNGGSENQKKAIENILNIPIHYYIKVNYNGLKAIVNSIGGVEVNVHRDMDYDDEWADPELHIHLSEGIQILDGEKAMEYIRWRKNNDGSGDSDIARTQRQQEFIVEVVKKSIKLNIIDVINVCYEFIRTDMLLKDVIYYGSELLNFDINTINKYSLPGEADNRYFYQDVEKTKEIIKLIYNEQ